MPDNNSETVVNGTRELRVQLDRGQMKKIGFRAVELEVNQTELIRQWIDAGLPLTPERVVGTSKEYEEGLAAILDGNKAIVEERDRLKKQVEELTAKLADRPVVRASKAAVSEELTALRAEVEALRLSDASLRATNKQLLAAIPASALKPDRPEPQVVAERGVDQTRVVSAPHVAPEPGMQANGLPVGKTVDGSGKIVDAEPAPF